VFWSRLDEVDEPFFVIQVIVGDVPDKVDAIFFTEKRDFLPNLGDGAKTDTLFKAGAKDASPGFVPPGAPL
jgi:hypothetical protein